MGFLMLSVPAIGPGSNVAGFLFAWGGAFAGGLVGSVVTSSLLGLRVRREGADRAAATLFGVLGAAAMALAPLAKGIVGGLLPESEAWYGAFDVAWLAMPWWFVYGIMVGFGVVVPLLGSKREATARSRGDQTPSA
jgi:hypothetical protein